MVQRFSNESAVAWGENDTQNTIVDETILLHNIFGQMQRRFFYNRVFMDRAYVGIVESAIATMTNAVLLQQTPACH